MLMKKMQTRKMMMNKRERPNSSPKTVEVASDPGGKADA
jgi:hypothetical protein